jgi:hypothetical protein
MSDNYFASLVCGVQLIVENRSRFVKTYPMLDPVRPGFVGIPFKLISHGSTILLLKLFHELHERFATFAGKRVVDGSPNAAD